MPDYYEEEHKRQLRAHEERLAQIREDTAREQLRKLKLENDARVQGLKAARAKTDHESGERFHSLWSRRAVLMHERSSKNRNGNRR